MWTKQSNYHMTKGSWSIAKFYIKNIVKYGLYENNALVGFYDSFDDAKKKHEEMINVD